MNKKSSGYVLVLVMFVIAMCAALIMAVVRNSIVYQRQAYYSLDNQKAKLLATSGLQLALDQISIIEPEAKPQTKSDAKPDSKPDANQDTEKKEQEPIEKRLFAKLINVVDKAQNFKFDQKDFGVDGTIDMYISCQQGKINLNQLTSAIKLEEKKEKEDQAKEGDDAKSAKPEPAKPEPQKQPEKTYAEVINDLVQKHAKVSLVASVKELLKKNGRQIEDPTELLLLPSFKALKDFVFLSPDALASKNKSQIYLMDLFTVSNSSGRINPWLLSRSFTKVLGFADKPRDKELKDKFKASMNWATDWDKVLAPIYGKNYASIDPEIKKMIAPDFEVSAFSVYVKASVGLATQRVYALCERDKKVTGVSPKSFVFKITKIYWL